MNDLVPFQLRIDYKRSAKLEREEKARKEGAILVELQLGR